MTHRLGHLPDLEAHVEEDLRERHVGRLVGAGIGAGIGELPTVIDYSGMLERVPDQGGTNSCVGQAFATSISMRARIEGHAIERPSAKAIYDIARLLDAPRVLVDDGSRPRSAIVGLQDYGLVAESRWPLTDANVNDKPPLDVFRAGLGAMLSAYYRIGGVDIATLLRVALAREFIPVFAMLVDAAYLGYGGEGIYHGLVGPERGSHMQAVVGYGADYFLVANSWGAGWGAGGFSRIADSFFNTAAVRDVLVPTVVPLSVS